MHPCVLVLLGVIVLGSALSTPSDQAPQTPPVPVVIYYETHCPQCIQFMTQQLYPAYKRLGRLIEPVLVPYGKASRSPGYVFVCQHGPQECHGNMVHACALRHLASTDRAVEYVRCTLDTVTGTQFLWQECAHRCGLNYSLVHACLNSQEGPSLLARMGEITDALRPPLTYVPTVVFGGSRALGPDASAEIDFLKAVCSRVEAEQTPRECVGVTGRGVGSLDTPNTGGRPHGLALLLVTLVGLSLCFT